MFYKIFVGPVSILSPKPYAQEGRELGEVCIAIPITLGDGDGNADSHLCSRY